MSLVVVMLASCNAVLGIGEPIEPPDDPLGMGGAAGSVGSSGGESGEANRGSGGSRNGGSGGTQTTGGTGADAGSAGDIGGGAGEPGNGGSGNGGSGNGGSGNGGSGNGGSGNGGSGNGESGNGGSGNGGCNLNGAFDTYSHVFDDEAVTASGFALSQDGLTAYISSQPSVDGGQPPPTTPYDIYKATRKSLAEAFGTPELVSSVSDPSVSDRSPWLASNGDLYFWRIGGGDSNLFVSTWDAPTQSFGTPMALSSLNSEVLDEDPSLSWDGKTIYFVSDRPGGDRNLYRATHSAGTFTDITAVSSLNSWTEEHHPVISRDELRIYLGSERDGIEGDTNGDIWISDRTSTTVAFPAPNNVLTLNSRGRDDPLLLSSDECTLYFMSNRDTGGAFTQTYKIYQATRAAN